MYYISIFTIYIKLLEGGNFVFTVTSSVPQAVPGTTQDLRIIVEEKKLQANISHEHSWELSCKNPK